MGTASLLVFTAFGMLFCAGARIVHLVLALLALLPPVALAVGASAYRRARILAFIDPWKDPQNTGFHIVQSLLALGSGGLRAWASAPRGRSSSICPKRTPTSSSRSSARSWGCSGRSIVLALFVAFAIRAFAHRAARPDRFGFLLAVGCALLIVDPSLRQHRGRHVVVAGHRRSAAVHLVRRQLADRRLVAVALILNVGRRALACAFASRSPAAERADTCIRRWRSPMCSRRVRSAKTTSRVLRHPRRARGAARRPGCRWRSCRARRCSASSRCALAHALAATCAACRQRWRALRASGRYGGRDRRLRLLPGRARGADAAHASACAAAIALLETNVQPGLTNRLLAPLVDEVWTAYDALGAVLPRQSPCARGRRCARRSTRQSTPRARGSSSASPPNARRSS